MRYDSRIFTKGPRLKAASSGLRLKAGLCAFLALCALAMPAVAAKKKAKAIPLPPLPPIATPYIVAEAESGRVIEEFDALRPWYPASTTKLMTIYVVFQAIRAGEITLETRINYGPNAAAQPASKMGFKPGTTLTLDNALKMMMVKSANDIAVAVAEAIGGSVNGFAKRMNDASAALGMDRSHWVNPHGLPDERQYTSARDMAILARALLEDFPEYRDFYKLPAISIGGRVLKNFNSLIAHYHGATGMKTGFICASGYNLVGSAERGGRRAGTDRGGVRRVRRQGPHTTRRRAARHGLCLRRDGSRSDRHPGERRLGQALRQADGHARICVRAATHERRLRGERGGRAGWRRGHL
jgi:D-alanyl-D-alanine carboxypeptidase